MSARPLLAAFRVSRSLLASAALAFCLQIGPALAEAGDMTVPAPRPRLGPLAPPGIGGGSPSFPGSRGFGFGFGGRESDLAVPPTREQAAPLPGPEEPRPAAAPKTREALLDDLFTRLRGAADSDEAEGIAGAIERVWLRSGSDTADLLMHRAIAALAAKKSDVSRALLDKIVLLDPDWAEAWNERATVRFIADDYAGAMEDIAHVLALEPRHYGALAGMGFILEKSDRPKEALRVFRKVLEIYPQQEDIRKAVDHLVPEVEGRDL